MNLAALATCLALAAPAEAATPAERSLEEGMARFRELEDRKAAEAFEAGLSAAPSPAVEAKLALYLGLARFNLLDPGGARAAFRRALAADAAVIPPDEANPRALELFGEERAALRAERWSSPRRIAGFAVAGAGVAALGGGLVFGLSAGRARDQAAGAATAEGAQGMLDVARTRALFANIFFAAGGALLAGGATVAFWPAASGSGGGLSVSGTW